jgi:membrane protein implicated in regulation of membrane protease activity
MLESGMVALILASSADVLIGLYWGALILGGGLLLVSALGGLGHHHADVDAGGATDTHGGVETDSGHFDGSFHHAVHGGTAALSTWLSLRFVVFFLAMFGAAGVILTYLTPLTRWLVCAVALVAGLAVGQSVHQLFRLIRRTSGDSTPQALDYVDQPARVTVTIVPPHAGEVALLVRGTERYVSAVAAESALPLEVGDEVLVVGYRDGVARVTPRRAGEPVG